MRRRFKLLKAPSTGGGSDVTDYFDFTGVANGYILKYDSGSGLFEAVTPTAAFTSSAISDFTEAAQDAVFGAVADSSTIDFTYTDASNSFTAIVIDGSITYAKMQNVSATSRILGRRTAGAGSVEECTLTQVLDFVGSAAQGDILYRGASSWSRLGAGTSGHFLKTNGAAADPSWAAASGGGTSAGELVCFPVAAFSASPGGWAGYSVFSHFKGTRILRNATSIKVRINIAAGSMIFSGIVLRRTLKNSTTYVDSVAVTVGGSATPTLTSGATLTDAISVTVDSDHDYYFIMYVNPATLAGAQFNSATTDTTPNAITGQFQLGDHRADATCGVGMSISNIYGVDAYFTA